MTQLIDILEQFRRQSASEFDKGRHFEKLVKLFLEHDDVQKQHYDRVWFYGDWAREHGWRSADIGIDLVARCCDGDGDSYAAIQCKFYARDHAISKKDIDSFLAASVNDRFTRLIIVDTTSKALGRNITAVLNQQVKPWHRIDITALEDSRINWQAYFHDQSVVQRDKKILRDHQQQALTAVEQGLAKADRGKLIMACGTGKTFTALRIAETLAGSGKRVLFMVPSLALMSQSVREWKNDARQTITAFAVCSDSKVGKRSAQTDTIAFDIHDLAFPATTDAARLAEHIARHDPGVMTASGHRSEFGRMTVVFSTYHSIGVIKDAQRTFGLPEFDLIICDEAHRTTGVTLADEDDSAFVRIHSNDHVKGKKRLYMTATPRVFSDKAKAKATQYEAELASMDDERTFGKTLFHRGFGWAVENDLLTDYKVIVLAVDEGLVSAGVQRRLKEGAELKLDEATKIVGCYKALSKTGLHNDLATDLKPMRRALAFCRSIALSKTVQREFTQVVDEYLDSEGINDTIPATQRLHCEIHHVDGTFNATARDQRLSWLKADSAEDTCRILTNAKCLSEGVDVPALDAILFLHPRKSQIDVIQSVGRVMRRAAGKHMGYVILPVAIPHGVEPEKALRDNDRYRVIWQILNALRAHDERLDASINKASLGEDISDKIEIVGVSQELNAVTAEVDDFATARPEPDGTQLGKGDGADPGAVNDNAASAPQQTGFIFDEFSRAIKAKIVEKCGTRDYWDTWAKDIARIAQIHITRITTITATDGPERDALNAFLAELHDDLNPDISEADAIEMLAQHLITRPVFDALFQGNRFTQDNPVSKAMTRVLEALGEHNLDKETDSLDKFYARVTSRAQGIATAQNRQALVLDLYKKFFKSAFPRTTEKLGIVYTPVDVVDFIIKSVNDMLKREFGQTLGSAGVHILDPFTGTGTFITRLLQSGLITREELTRKYQTEIHANEIVLLAYYIAAINIESVYQEQAGTDTYAPFTGICLTDTFHLYEQDRDMIANLMPDNSERRTRQKQLDIRVIVGNPPYSAGQKSANDNAANVAYKNLDARIAETYAADSSATLQNSLYDSYIRAIRWASDRIGDAGVIGFVSGSAWIERSFADGMRKCLQQEFSSLYVFHLRGDIRKNMLSKGRAGEGGNIFGSSSMTGAAISILVKNPAAAEQGKIYFHDIGDYLDRNSKLAIIRRFGSIDGLMQEQGWQTITPDEQHDWLNQGVKDFADHIAMGDKKDKIAPVIFENYSLGVSTSRDAWCYNASKVILEANMRRMIGFYNSEVDRYGISGNGVKAEDFIDADPRKMSWDRTQKNDLVRGKKVPYRPEAIAHSLYRPFQSQWLYFDKYYNNCVYQVPRIFPDATTNNRVIAVTGIGGRTCFSILMLDRIPNYDLVEKGQCFPLYLYDPPGDNDLFGNNTHTRRDAITDAGLRHFQQAYPGEGQVITKEDLFYYLYGLLHAPDYRERFQNNLTKALPRIPAVKRFVDFMAFVQAGRDLGDLHVNFDAVEPYPVTIKEGDLHLAAIDDPVQFYRVTKMTFGGKGKQKDKTVVHYNNHITLTNIPPRAYDYEVNGKPALEWVMERQTVKTDKASGIVNNANDYANETMGDPAYPLKLLQRVVTVSLKTLDIVAGLPALEIKQ